jgi:hypothetical protein
VGSGNVGAAAGAEVLNNWINAQIGQYGSTDPFDLWIGALAEAAPDPSAMVDGAEAGARGGRWTCPNDNSSCTASANSAKREPKRIFDRNQSISLRVHAPCDRRSTACHCSEISEES